MIDYPHVGFQFSVDFLDLSSTDKDTCFQSVSGLSSTMETETIIEGGENRFAHQLPVRLRTSDLVLKRGVVKDSMVIAWCRNAFERFTFKPITLVVKLLDEEQKPLISWNVVHVWPKKWVTSELNAGKSEVLIETLELNYNYFIINHSPPQ